MAGAKAVRTRAWPPHQVPNGTRQMTTPPILRKDFYVYALFREDGVTPFYIGLGCRDRWVQHERYAHRNRSYKDRIILKMRRDGILTVPKIKLAEGLPRAEAAQLEIDLILLVGRLPLGTLVNKTSGGDGLFNPDEETRQKMRDARKHYVCSPETREKLRVAMIGRKMGPMSDDTKAKIRARVLGFRHTQEAKDKISARSSQMKLTPERKEKLRQARLGSKHSPEAIEKIRAASTGRIKSPESIAKQRASFAGFKHSPQTIEKMRQKQQNRSPVTRARISASAKEGWKKRRQNAVPSEN